MLYNNGTKTSGEYMDDINIKKSSFLFSTNENKIVKITGNFFLKRAQFLVIFLPTFLKNVLLG